MAAPRIAGAADEWQVQAWLCLPVKVADTVGLALHFASEYAIRKLVEDRAHLLDISLESPRSSVKQA